MIRIMQLFDLIKSNFKILINLPSLHYSSNSKQIEKKIPQNSINQSI